MTMVQSKSQSKQAALGASKPKKGAKPAKKSGSSAGQSQGLVAYFKSIVAEGKKVTWPTMPQIWANTIIVLLMTVLFSAGLWAVDNTFRLLIQVLTVDLPRLVA